MQRLLWTKILFLATWPDALVVSLQVRGLQAYNQEHKLEFVLTI